MTHKDNTTLDDFFTKLKQFYEWHYQLTGSRPRYLVINPLVLQVIAKHQGFYERPELGTEVTAYSPVVRFFRFSRDQLVEIRESPSEIFLHFE